MFSTPLSITTCQRVVREILPVETVFNDSPIDFTPSTTFFPPALKPPSTTQSATPRFSFCHPEEFSNVILHGGGWFSWLEPLNHHSVLIDKEFGEIPKNGASILGEEFPKRMRSTAVDANL